MVAKGAQPSARVSIGFVCTLFARLQTHDIAKFGLKRPGLTDAGSIAAPLSGELRTE